jgi:hypothetical protein
VEFVIDWLGAGYHGAAKLNQPGTIKMCLPALIEVVRTRDDAKPCSIAA